MKIYLLMGAVWTVAFIAHRLKVVGAKNFFKEYPGAKLDLGMAALLVVILLLTVPAWPASFLTVSYITFKNRKVKGAK